MKKALSLLLIVCLFIATETTAQNNGFYGKKIALEVNGLANVALFHHNGNYDAPFYKKKGDNLEKGSDWLNGGFNIAGGIALKRDLMIGMETGWWFFNVAGPTYLNSNNNAYGYTFRHEILDMRTFSIMPTVTFGGKKGLLPVGINHQVGIAYTRTKTLDHDYMYRPEGPGSYTQANLDFLNNKNGGFVNYENVFQGFSLVYTLKVRIPVSKSVMINYGLRYAMNFTSSSYDPPTANQMPNIQLYEEIRRARFRTPLSLSVGITLAL